MGLILLCILGILFVDFILTGGEASKALWQAIVNIVNKIRGK